MNYGTRGWDNYTMDLREFLGKQYQEFQNYVPNEMMYAEGVLWESMPNQRFPKVTIEIRVF